jgi:dTMP kinase
MTATPSYPGRFIVLDGVDGCGKSTQAKRLVDSLRTKDEVEVQHLREPGSTTLGEGLRELLLSREQDMGPEVESLLFCAARRQMLDLLVRPALEKGQWVVCERFHPSTLAYQGGAGGVPTETLARLLESWAGDPRPDLVLILDLDPTAARQRRGKSADRIEDKGQGFQEEVARAMRHYAKTHPAAELVQGEGSADEVAERILAHVDGLRVGPR